MEKRLHSPRTARGNSTSGHFAIYIMPVDGGPAVQVTDDASVAQNPAWTADGTSIVFDAHSKDVRGYIAIVDVRDIAR
jgi:Tol biopolymer transport system component